MYSFNPKLEIPKVVEWLCGYFYERSGGGEYAVVAISGGKDSAVTAALCSTALGKDKVIGVLMPCYDEDKMSDAELVCRSLGIDSMRIVIGNSNDDLAMNCTNALVPLGLARGADENGIPAMPIYFENAETVLPSRMRMAALMYVAQSLVRGRVANTTNLSKIWVGNTSLFGDAAGHFAPLAEYTSTEVVELGRFLKLPERIMQKPSEDGLCGKTDQERLGFSYANELDPYLRTGIVLPEYKRLIDNLHRDNLYKMRYSQGLPHYTSGFPIYATL